MSELESYEETLVGEEVSGEDALPVFRGETYEEHVQAWINVSEEVEERRWQLGAIAASLETVFGENVKSTFAADVGVSARTVREYAQAYRAFATGARAPLLSYTHHRIAARSEAPQRAIDEAADRLYSTRQMEVRVEAEALGEEERERVVRAAEERRLSGEETRRLVRARIDKREKEEAKERERARYAEEVVPDDELPEAIGDAAQGQEIVEEANRQADQELSRDIDEVLEVCPYCGSPSSAWARRPEGTTHG